MAKYPKEYRMEVVRAVLNGRSKRSMSSDVCPSNPSRMAINRWIEEFKKLYPDYVPTPLSEFEINEAISRSNTVLVIPDLHCPFEHPDSLLFLLAVKRKFTPNKIVCLGDEADFHAFSKYPNDPDGMSAGTELQKAREHLIPFFVEFPKVMVCTSNHTVRPLKRMFEAYLPEAFYPSYSTILNAPDGWEWRNSWEIDDVLYLHGEGKSGANAHLQFMKAYKKSVAIGHIHSYAGVNYEGPHFAMNTGCLVDVHAYAFKYARNMPIPISLGCGIVFNGKAAHFLPMHLNGAGRWTGKL